MRRVVLVLADGLRPDAITPTDMPSLDVLARVAFFSVLSYTHWGADAVRWVG